MRRLVPVLLTLLLVPAANAMAASPWERNRESIGCNDTMGSSPFYNGDSASALYDGTFKAGHDVPAAFLDNYVPQGLGTWPNYGGKGSDLLIQAGYHDGGPSAIIGIVPGGPTTAISQLKRPNGAFVSAHVGGVAVVASWLFVAGETVGGRPTVLRFPLSAVRSALASGSPLKAAAEIPLRAGTPGFAASFLAPEGRALWIGTFNEDNRNRMYKFGVGPRGALKRVGGAGAWRQVPKKTQGLTVTKDHFIFSTSWTREARSNVYVVRRGYKYLDNAYPQDLVCFAAPSMSEGITRSNGRAFLSFESGSYEYRGGARNVIDHLHITDVATLTAMT